MSDYQYVVCPRAFSESNLTTGQGNESLIITRYNINILCVKGPDVNCHIVHRLFNFVNEMTLTATKTSEKRRKIAN